jgi:hypothetical protein
MFCSELLNFPLIRVFDQQHHPNGHATETVAARGSRVDGHVEIYAKVEQEEAVADEGESCFLEIAAVQFLDDMI